MNVIKISKATANKLAVGAVVLGAPILAHAEDTIDTATTKITGGVTGIAAMVGALAAIGAGVVIYKKIKGYFSKTS